MPNTSKSATATLTNSGSPMPIDLTDAEHTEYDQAMSILTSKPSLASFGDARIWGASAPMHLNPGGTTECVYVPFELRRRYRSRHATLQESGAFLTLDEWRALSHDETGVDLSEEEARGVLYASGTLKRLAAKAATRQ